MEGVDPNVVSPAVPAQLVLQYTFPVKIGPSVGFV
jgi:hypothetical protein